MRLETLNQSPEIQYLSFSIHGLAQIGAWTQLESSEDRTRISGGAGGELKG